MGCTVCGKYFNVKSIQEKRIIIKIMMVIMIQAILKIFQFIIFLSYYKNLTKKMKIKLMIIVLTIIRKVHSNLNKLKFNYFIIFKEELEFSNNNI